MIASFMTFSLSYVNLPRSGSNLAARLTAAPRVRDQQSDATRRHSSAHTVSAAGENDRNARAQHDSSGIGVRQERQQLGENVPRLKVRREQDVRVARDG